VRLELVELIVHLHAAVRGAVGTVIEHVRRGAGNVVLVLVYELEFERDPAGPRSG
jgi:hypothetical protein